MSEQLQNFIRVGVVGVVILVCALSVWWGVVGGKQKAQGALIAHNTDQVKQAINFFYRDQDRFPTVAEFSDRGGLGLYLSSQLPELSVAGCDKAVSYSILANKQPQLSVCLPRSSGGYKAGINTIVLEAE